MTRNVFISGGTGSIGEALVRRFATDGYVVHFQYCHREQAARAFELELGARGHQIDFLKAWNVPPLEIDVLINNAGVNLSGRHLPDVSDDELASSLEVNVVTAFRFSRDYVNGMISNRWGRIININSLYGVRGAEWRLSYTVSKHALKGLTVSMARDLACHGITVNDICPGPVKSRMLDEMGRLAVSAGRASSIEDYFTGVGGAVPIGRLIRADEVAAAAAFLASDLAASCTGVALRVDGGIAC